MRIDVFATRFFGVAILFFGGLLVSGCATVGPGEVGVLWRASNGTDQQTYGEGVHVISPWNEMYTYDLRAKSHNEMLEVIASNGLTIKLDTAVRFRLKPDEIVALQEQIGPKYYATILEPVLRSEARRVAGRYTPEEIYSTKRDIIEHEIKEGAINGIQGAHIELDKVLIKFVSLPEAIRDAIDEKLEAEQNVLKMKYVLEVSKADADKKRIDAQGTADYDRIVAGSLSPDILEFERIQQLGRLADSGNAKTVVIAPPGASPRLILPSPTEPHTPRGQADVSH